MVLWEIKQGAFLAFISEADNSFDTVPAVVENPTGRKETEEAVRQWGATAGSLCDLE